MTKMLSSNLSALENDTLPVAIYFLNPDKYWLFEGLADKLKGTNLQGIGRSAKAICLFKAGFEFLKKIEESIADKIADPVIVMVI